MAAYRSIYLNVNESLLSDKKTYLFKSEQRTTHEGNISIRVCHVAKSLRMKKVNPTSFDMLKITIFSLIVMLRQKMSQNTAKSTIVIKNYMHMA